MNTEFGKFCKMLRLKNNEVGKDMARKLNISISMLSLMERGERKVSKTFFKNVIKNYKLSKKENERLEKIIEKNNIDFCKRKLSENECDHVYGVGITENGFSYYVFKGESLDEYIEFDSYSYCPKCGKRLYWGE